MTAPQILAVLRQMEVLEDFTPEQLRWVAEHGCVVEVPAGRTAMRVGDSRAGFWLPMGGRVTVIRPDAAFLVALPRKPASWSAVSFRGKLAHGRAAVRRPAAEPCDEFARIRASPTTTR